MCLPGAENTLSGIDTWGYREALPAVVNPVAHSPRREVVSLRGEWEFVTRAANMRPRRHPGWDRFFSKPWKDARKIIVPGCWEAQGVGQSGASITWDCKWDHGPRELRNVFMGEGWYRKTVDIPAAWQGKRVWLKIGGVRSQGWFWVNEQPVAWVDNYCGTYKYDITDLVKADEKAVVVAAVNNAIPSRKGQMVSSHKFGGLYRDVELEATPDMRIDDLWVRGDFDKRQAEVHATVAYASARLKNPALRVTIKTVRRVASGKVAPARSAGAESHTLIVFAEGERKTEVVVNISLDPFNAWSPEHPDLYLAEVTLCDGVTPVHGWNERFGVRKIEVRGDRFFLNNKPFFVRGYGDDFVYPLTMASPVSKNKHLKHLKTARAAGFNYVRLHTHCELPEYFEAADEAGIMVQPELPYYGDYPTEAFTFDPMRDLRELYRHYRRYISFTTYCTGNEGLLGHPLDEKIYQLAKRLDSDRLMIHQDGTFNTAANSDFRNGPINVWAPDSFKCDAPFVAHEYLNLSVKQDPRLESRFSGAWMPPVTMAKRDKWLKRAGLDRRWGDACQNAQHRLQAIYQKRGIESARFDPACDGYSFWTIVDVVVQQGDTYSAQGLFNPFWEPKINGATPKDFRMFNGVSALLLKTDPASRIATSGDAVQADFWISHYGELPLSKPRVKWVLRNDKTILARGECGASDVATGETRLLSETQIRIPKVVKPVQAVLEVSVGVIHNTWDFWVFPKRNPRDGKGVAVNRVLLPALEKLYSGLVVSGTSEAKNARLLISQIGAPDVEAALADGKSVLLINGTDGKPNVSLGWWAMGNQVGTAFADHPALGDFPHGGFLSALAFRILKQGQALPLAGVLPDDMIVVGEGRANYFLYAGCARSGKGKALMTFGLDLISGTPEGNSLLDGMIRYARSDAFNPKGVVTLPASRNGWKATVKAGDKGQDDLPLGVAQLAVARALKGRNELIWKTRPAPADVQTKSVYAVTWDGGMGYFAEPPGSFALYVNNRKVIDVQTISKTDALWFSNDKTISLKYARNAETEEYGTFTLTLPSSKVVPDKPLLLKVVGSDSNSRRWFGVMERW